MDKDKLDRLRAALADKDKPVTPERAKAHADAIGEILDDLAQGRFLGLPVTR